MITHADLVVLPPEIIVRIRHMVERTPMEARLKFKAFMNEFAFKDERGGNWAFDTIEITCGVYEANAYTIRKIEAQTETSSVIVHFPTNPAQETTMVCVGQGIDLVNFSGETKRVFASVAALINIHASPGFDPTTISIMGPNDVPIKLVHVIRQMMA
jgi:hypothetical protein